MVEENLLVLLLAGHFEVRGSCAYTLRLLEHLPNSGVQAEMICSSAELIPARKRDELSIHEFRQLDIPLLNLLLVSRVAKELGALSPDLLHVQTRGLARLGMRLARLLDVPYVLTVHDFPEPGERLPFDRERGKKIIAVSEAVRRCLLEIAGVSDELVELVPSGVEVRPLAEPPSPTAPARVPVIGTAGPLERIKGHHVFLEAARRVLDAGFEAEFVVAGSGREETFLRRLAGALGIAPRVTFAPHVRDYLDVLEALDIFVLPSLQQGLGTVMIEAMALAKPVIAARVGGVYSVVRDAENGLLIPSGDSVALAEAIIRLLKSPAEAALLGAAARAQVARDFNVELMARRTADLYRRIAQGP